MLQNARVTAFIVSVLLMENLQGGGGGGGKITPTEIRVKFYHKMFLAHKFTISYFFNPS